MENNYLLANGVKIPLVGIGTYPLNGETLKKTVYDAYHVGYRLFDTADNYYNENDLGDSLTSLYAKTAATREDFFLVSKLSDELYPPGQLGGGLNKGIFFWKSSPIMQEPNAVHKVVYKKMENSLKALHTDYLDLLLMHWPYPDFFEEIWYEMESLYKKGVVRAIGVCNCRERHLEKLRKHCSIFPMVNQYESSPINSKVALADYCRKYGIHVMTYSPLMSLRLKIESSYYRNYLHALSLKYNKSEAQIILRFDVQRGFTPIPKSSRIERLNQNIALFDFELEQSEMKTLYGFNEDKQYLPESKVCPGM